MVDHQLVPIRKSSQVDTQSIVQVELEPSGVGIVTATVTRSLHQDFVPARLSIDFRWHSGPKPFDPIDEPESFNWLDTRREWRSTTSGSGTKERVEILDAATATPETLQANHRIDTDEPISIWAYGSPADFADTLQTNVWEAVAGVSYPERCVISAILPIGQPAETYRIIPHEISHIALSRATATPWSRPPLWFGEGLAIDVQSGGSS